jgi:hypothetical protein
MPGVLNQPTAQRENPLLTKIAQDAEAKVPPKLKEQFLSIMVAGGKLMWSQELASERQAFDQALQQHGNVPEVVAHAVLKVSSIIQNESKAKEPLEAMGLAAQVFMAHTLQYVEAKHKMPVSKEVIGETAQLVGVNLLKMFGVTEQQVKDLFQKQGQVQSAGEQVAPAPEAEEESDAIPGEPTDEEDV